MGVGYLTTEGTYRASRGRVGADPLMGAVTGPNGRFPITTGEAAIPFGSAPNYAHWRRAFDPHSSGFSVLTLGVVFFLIHAFVRPRLDVAARGSVGK